MRLRQVLVPLFIILAIIIVGTSGYMVIEGYTFLEGLYMTIITVTTVGYYEVRPLSDAGKIFNIILISSSITTTAFALARLTQYVVDGEINKYFKNRKIMTAINQLENHVIVCGFGRNGRQAAQTLMQHKEQFVIIEKEEDRLEDALLLNGKILFIKGDATDDETLIRSGIKKAKALITALPEDADNVFIVLSARSLNERIHIISRASHASTAPKLRKAGADNVILPDQIGGTHMATLVSKPDVVEFIDFLSGEEGGAIHLESVRYDILPRELRDKTLNEIMMWRKTGVNCIGIKNTDGKFVINPPENTRISPGMKVIVLGTKEQIEEMKGNVDRSHL